MSFLLFFKCLFGCAGFQLWYVGGTDQGSNLGPLQWGHGVVAAGPQGSPYVIYKYMESQETEGIGLVGGNGKSTEASTNIPGAPASVGLIPLG